MKKSPLVYQNIENVSREPFSKYGEVIGSERALDFGLWALGLGNDNTAACSAQSPMPMAQSPTLGAGLRSGPDS